MDDFPFYKKLKLPHIQLILAILVTSLCIVDYVSGLIYALVLMLIYYEVYNKKKEKEVLVKKIDKYDTNVNKKILENFERTTINQRKSVVNFISDDLLRKASGEEYIDEYAKSNPTIKTDIDFDAGGQNLGPVIANDSSNNYSTF
jgi:hypothetical protein